MKTIYTLPALSGAWLVGYRVLWAALLLMALYGVTWGGWHYRAETLRDYQALAGVGLQWHDVGSLRISPLGDEAKTAGVIANSEVLSVDGKAVSFAADGLSAARILEGAEDTAVNLTLRATDGATYSVVLRRSSDHIRELDAAGPTTQEQRSIFNWATRNLVMLMMVGAAIMIFRRNNSDIVGALLSIGMMNIAASPATAALFGGSNTVYATSSALTGICMTLGLLLFPSGRFDSVWTWFGVVVTILGYGFTASMVNSGIHPGLEMLVGVTIFGACVLAIRRRFKLARGVERQQIKWVMLGTAVFLILNIIASLIKMMAPLAISPSVQVLGAMAAAALSALAVSAIIVGLLISLFRHRLYDAEMAISRSFSLGAMTIVVVAVFAGAEKVIEVVGAQYLGNSLGGSAGAVAAAMAAVMILPLHNRLSGWAQRRFQGAITRLKQDLPHTMDEMREINSVSEVASAAIEGVKNAVLSRHGAILVKEEEGWAVANDTGLIPLWRPAADSALWDIDKVDMDYPVRVALTCGAVQPTGWLLLGPRPDGTLYGKDDREAVLSVAPYIARALRVAQLRQSVSDKLELRLQKIEALLVNDANRPVWT